MKLQTDAQIPDSIDNQRLLTISLPSFEANQSRPPPDRAKREDKNVNAPHQTHTGDRVTETGAQKQLRSLLEPRPEVRLPVVMGFELNKIKGKSNQEKADLTGQPPRAVKCCVGSDLT